MKQHKNSPFSRVFFLCWIVYFTTYLGRLNYSACIGEMILSEGFSKTQVGFIGTAFFFSYGAGQLISGFLGDRLSPKKMIFAGSLCSGICNLLMAFFHIPVFMTIIWCLNGFAQSLIWSPILRLLSDSYSGKQLKDACIYINSSMPAGTFCAYAAAAILLELTGNWRFVFIFSGCALTAISFIWYIGMYQHTRTAPGQADPSPVSKDSYKYVPMRKLLLSSGIAFLAVSLLVQGMLKDGITTWIPTYMTETFHLSSSVSIITTAFIPMCNLGGIYLTRLMSKKFKDEILASAAAFLFAFICLILLFFLQDSSVFAVFVLLAGITTCMMIINTLLISVLPSFFAGIGKTSTMSGILNSSVYAGCALSSYGFGAMSAVFGWKYTIAGWAAFGLMGLLFCLAGKKLWNHFKGETLCI